MGIWLVVYLVEHLLTNSQAALWIGSDGSGFIRAVNAIHDLPYLKVIEIVLIAVPFIYHGYKGVRYMFTGKYNQTQGDGRRPGLSKFSGNHAYSWQRWTAWILLIGVLLHVVQFRFVEYPRSIVTGGTQSEYLVRLSLDDGLYTIASRMGVQLWDEARIEKYQARVDREAKLLSGPAPTDGESFNPQLADELDRRQKLKLDEEWLGVLESKTLKKGQIFAATHTFGMASLLVVRDTFKNPWMMVLYTIFVMAAVYHGFRGLWSFMIVWGVTLTARSQRALSKIAVGLMLVVGFLGLATIWMTYWVTLRN